ncbi:MAG TPA: c-type cytochrome [Chitinophagaceae bacterium]|nr:c-type cytochrome [Chitinophagaceae bacterium]
MKKIVISVCSVIILSSCGGGDKNEKKDAAAAPAKEESKSQSANTLEDKAIEIIAKTDCFTCHKIDETNVGPSYKNVAKKYENTEANVNLLVEKIINGGKGNWGEVPMAPHTALAKEDVTTIVQYILSLRNN